MILGTAQSIATATKLLRIAFENLQEIEADRRGKSLLFRIVDLPAKIYHVFKLNQKSNTLLDALNASHKCKDADVFLEAGDALQLVHLFERARYCYHRTVQELRDGDHQDIRLLALMGVLECTVEISRAELLAGRADPAGGEAVAKIWEAAILSDLYAASRDVQEEIRKRLSIVSQKLFSNSLRADVNGSSWIFNKSSF